MAPYAEPNLIQSKLKILKDLLRLRNDGLGFELTQLTNYCYEYLRDQFERTRFDVIAGVVQVFTEQMMVEWVKADYKIYGYPTFGLWRRGFHER